MSDTNPNPNPNVSYSRSQTLLPVPDPTQLTTEQLRRELSALRELIEARLNGMDKSHSTLVTSVYGIKDERHKEMTTQRELIETRINGMDKANELLKDNVRLVSVETDKQLSHLKELHDEKFESIQTQFKERDVRSDQDKIAATTAVNAALQAQKEAAASQNESNSAAITKSEAATAKQIDGILALLASNTKNIDDKIAVINGRLDRGEGGLNQQKETKSDTHMTIGSVMGIIGGVVGVLALFGMVIFGVINSNNKSGSLPTVIAPAVVPLNHPN